VGRKSLGFARSSGPDDDWLKPNTVHFVGQIIAQRGLSCPNPTDDIGSSSAPPACHVSEQYRAEARLTMPGLLSNPPNLE
jgi:hypothetical protein